MMDPSISIIVPIYNVEEYLSRCLDSIVGQTYQNLEIILVDDGSSDGCGVICDQYAEKDNRIRVIHQENSGVAAARNAALDCMTGEYVMFVDSDDWISEDAVQVLYDRMVRDGSDMAIGKHANVYEDGKVDDKSYDWIKDEVITGQEALGRLGDDHRFAVVPWGKLYKKLLFANIAYPPMTCGEDCWIYPLLLNKCKKISSINRLVYNYYQRNDSVLHIYNEQAQKDNLNANLHMTRFLLDEKYYNAAHKWYGNSITRALQCKDKKMAKQMINQYFKKKEQRHMMRNQDLKIIIKWLGIYIPLLGNVMLIVNDYRKRK